MSQFDFIARRARRTITRWRQPFEGEPAYGFLLRLAGAHRFDTMPVFATDLGLGWVSSIMPAECLAAACAAEFATDSDRQRLARWTPDVLPTFSFVTGEQIRRDDFSLRTRRYCPACLAESAHHRVWFDLQFMIECPLHAIALSNRDPGDGTFLGFHHTILDALPSGERLAVSAPRLPAIADTLEGYALHRLGLAEKREYELLESFPLSDVVEAAELVGRLALGGWRSRMPLIGSAGFEAPALRSAGWPWLRDGAAGIKALLSEVADKAPARTFGARTLFGWGYYNLSFKSDLAQRIRALMIDVAAERGLNGRRYVEGWRRTSAGRTPVRAFDADVGSLAADASSRSTLDGLAALVGYDVGLLDVAQAVADQHVVTALAATVGPTVSLGVVADIAGGDTMLGDIVARLPARLTVREIAVLIGESQNAVVAIGEAKGLFEPHDGRKGSPLLASQSAMPAFLSTAQSVVTRSQAAAMLGVPPETFAEIVLGGHVAKFATRWETIDEARERGHARAGAIEDRFEIAEIERFLDAIPLKAPVDVSDGRTVLLAPDVMTLPRMLAYTRMDAGDFFREVAAGGIVVFARTRRPRPRRGDGRAPLEDALGDFRLRLCDQQAGHFFQARWLSINFTREQSTSEDSMSQRQACAMLDINPRTAKVLSDLGYFKLLPSKDRCDRQKLDRKSVEAFAARFAAGKLYASVLGCQDAKVSRRAKDAGVETLWEKEHPGEDLGRINGIYDRADMRRAFALTEDPDRADPVLNGWKAMADRLGREKSLFALWQVKPGMTATFSTADRLWPIDVSYVFDEQVENVDRHVCDKDGLLLEKEDVVVYEIRAEFDVGGKLAEVGKDRFVESIARGLPRGVSASLDGGRLLARMKAVMVVDAEGLSPAQVFARYAADDVPVVALMLNTIKASFEDGPRVFDRKVFGIWPLAFTRLRRAA